MGDFNFNLIADNSFADDINTTLNLKQVISESTRTSGKSCMLIDHIYLSRDVIVSNSGTFNLQITCQITWRPMHTLAVLAAPAKLLLLASLQLHIDARNI